MTPPLTLARWLTAPRPASTPIAWQDDCIWTLGHLRHDVARLIPQLQQHEGSRWALCLENSYLFLVALLATLHAGKTPVLPGHSRQSLLSEQRALFDGVISDSALDGSWPQLIITSAMTIAPHTPPLLALRDDATIELYTSGTTGQPKRVIKTVRHLDCEAALLADRFAEQLAGTRVVSSVTHQHLYGLTFRIILPMALGLPLHAGMLWYSEQLAALAAEERYTFISSPAFLKRLDLQLPAPPMAMIVSAGGELSLQSAAQTAAWLKVWPDEIYGSSETGVVAWRQRQPEETHWQPFPGISFREEEAAVRVFSPLFADNNGLLLDDTLEFDTSGHFRLRGRRDRVVKIEEKRISLREVEQRLLALTGVREAAAVPLLRGDRTAIGVLVVLDDAACASWGKNQERTWRRTLRAWLEPVAIPRYWHVVDAIPVNSMNKRIDAQLQELFDETPRN